MKSSTSLRIFSCVVSSIGLGVGAIVGLLELVGVGEEEGAVDDVDVGVGAEGEGRGEVVVGRGEDEGVDEEAEEGFGFGCSRNYDFALGSAIFKRNLNCIIPRSIM